jgi:hypothetical protein
VVVCTPDSLGSKPLRTPCHTGDGPALKVVVANDIGPWLPRTDVCAQVTELVSGAALFRWTVEVSEDDVFFLGWICCFVNMSFLSLSTSTGFVVLVDLLDLGSCMLGSDRFSGGVAGECSKSCSSSSNVSGSFS